MDQFNSHTLIRNKNYNHFKNHFTALAKAEIYTQTYKHTFIQTFITHILIIYIIIRNIYFKTWTHPFSKACARTFLAILFTMFLLGLNFLSPAFLCSKLWLENLNLSGNSVAVFVAQTKSDSTLEPKSTNWWPCRMETFLYKQAHREYHKEMKTGWVIHLQTHTKWYIWAQEIASRPPETVREAQNWFFLMDIWRNQACWNLDL